MRRAAAPPTFSRFSREEFLTRRWHYNAGEHVTFVAPTQAGKTTMMFELAEHTVSQRLPAVMLVMKPKDSTVTRWVKRLGWRRVRGNPRLLSQRWMPGGPPGWVIWPKYGRDFAKTDREMQRTFYDVIHDSFLDGNRVLLVDELYGLSELLKLNKELIRVWTQGASQGCGLWTATQKPTHVPLWAFNQAEHIFLTNDPDARNRERFREIGGINPQWIDAGLSQLDKYEWLYIRRTGRKICIVAA